jgi:hypothetical protein
MSNRDLSDFAKPVFPLIWGFLFSFVAYNITNNYGLLPFEYSIVKNIESFEDKGLIWISIAIGLFMAAYIYWGDFDNGPYYEAWRDYYIVRQIKKFIPSGVFILALVKLLTTVLVMFVERGQPNF